MLWQSALLRLTTQYADCPIVVCAVERVALHCLLHHMPPSLVHALPALLLLGALYVPVAGTSGVSGSLFVCIMGGGGLAAC